MAENTQKFLDAEESAEKLMEALQRLHDEATNYHNSAEELDTVRNNLVGLIEATQEVSRGTHEAVQTLMSIGGPEILAQLDTLSQQTAAESAANAKRFSLLRTLVIIGLILSGLGAVAGILSLFK